MNRKREQKEWAVALRKEGKTYAEILSVIPVAKSTLAIWLHSVGLAKSQKQRYTKFRMLTQKKGAEARRRMRIESTKKIIGEAKAEIRSMTDNDLWLMGIMLYWAEGSKQKPWSTGTGLVFSNSDPLMLQLFVLWLRNSIKVPTGDIGFEIYLHETSRHRLEDVRRYWSKTLSLPLSSLETIYFKKGAVKTNRRKIGEDYFGVVRVKVKASSGLSRKVTGWVEGICEHWGIV